MTGALKKIKIRLVLDNLKVHSFQEVKDYLATVPWYTIGHGTWMISIHQKQL